MSDLDERFRKLWEKRRKKKPGVVDLDCGAVGIIEEVRRPMASEVGVMTGNISVAIWESNCRCGLHPAERVTTAWTSDEPSPETVA